MKHLFGLCLLIITTLANADDSSKIEENPAALGVILAPTGFKPRASYISTHAYTQNPFIGLPSLGGTQYISESISARHNVAQKWFADGTWNVQGVASYLDHGFSC